MATRTKQRIDEPLLIALACGSTVDNAAKTLGVSSRTVQRRLADPEFQKRLTEMKSDMVGRAAGMLTAGSLEAVKMLMLLQQPTQPPTVRLGAARTVLELGIKMRLSLDVDKRIAMLEQQMNGSPEC